MSKHPGVIAWAIAIACLLGYEYWALVTHHETLSRAVFTVTHGWDLAGPLLGFLIGGLFIHFFWHWDPKDPNDHRG